jgi:hypothetical protein
MVRAWPSNPIPALTDESRGERSGGSAGRVTSTRTAPAAPTRKTAPTATAAAGAPRRLSAAVAISAPSAWPPLETRLAQAIPRNGCDLCVKSYVRFMPLTSLTESAHHRRRRREPGLEQSPSAQPRRSQVQMR